MKNTLIIFAIGALFLLNLQVSQVSAAAAKTCKDQPLLTYVDTFVGKYDGYFNGRPEGERRGDGKRFLAEEGKRASIDAALTEFKAYTAKSVTDLKICTPYNNQVSCCTADFENKVIKKVVRAYFAKTFKNQPKVHKIQKAMLKTFSKCLDKKQLVELKGNASMKEVKQDFRKCHKQGIFAQLNLIRGTFCSLCVDPANIDTVFSGADSTLKMKIKPADFKSYDDAIQASLTCYETAANKFKTTVEGISISDKCKSRMDKVKKFLDDGKQKIGKKDCKSEATLLGDGCSKELADDGKEDSGLDTDRRILVEGGSFVEDNTNGVSAYIVDTTQNAELDTEAATLDQSDATYEQKLLDSESSTGSIVLLVNVLVLAIFVLFI